MYPFDFQHRPAGFEPLENEPIFDPARHLQLERPQTVYGLDELGYSEDVLRDAPASFAATSVFRILSDEGAALLYDTVKRLEDFCTSNPRIARNVRGGVYRSKFLRELCLSQEVTKFLSGIVGLQLMPHTIPHQLGHLNYNPKTLGENVDKWHVDTLRFDYVMFVTDPKRNQGGQFQYFKGTKEEMAALKAEGQAVPPERIISPDMPGPGYAILQQGNLVVHQAKGLTAPGERITMVNGYIPFDPDYPDYARYDQLCHADPAHVVTTEYSRHAAVQTKRFLEKHLIDQPFSDAQSQSAEHLEYAAEILRVAAEQIRAGKGQMEHFGD